MIADDFFSYLRLEDRISADHPLRAIRELVDAALAQLSRAFAKLYARDGRPSIPPECLLRHPGRELVEWLFVLTAAAHNLVRIRTILAATG
jgi:hypothetical protein